MFEVAIVGLGLMGGSLALALKQTSARRVLGIEPDARTRAWVRERSIVDEITDDLAAVNAADIIILAAPVQTIIDLVPRVGVLAHDDALVLDLGSTKRLIVQALDELPARIHALGGHPLCGKETHGIEFADAQLFRNKLFVLTPTVRTRDADSSRARALIVSLGAHVIEMKAAQHDHLLALTSHLPYVVSTALMLTALEQDETQWTELVASGFRDTSRLAASDETVMRDILMTNHDNVALWLRHYADHISELANLIERQEANTIAEQLRRAAQARRQLFKS